METYRERIIAFLQARKGQTVTSMALWRAAWPDAIRLSDFGLMYILKELDLYSPSNQWGVYVKFTRRRQRQSGYALYEVKVTE